MNYELMTTYSAKADHEVKDYLKEVDKDRNFLIDLCLYRRVEELTKRILPLGIRDIIKEYLGKDCEAELFYKMFVHKPDLWFNTSLYYKVAHYHCLVNHLQRNLRGDNIHRFCGSYCNCVDHVSLLGPHKTNEWLKRIIYIWSIYKTKDELCKLNI